MKKIFYIYTFLIFLVLLTERCESVYEPKKLDNSKNIVVIDGIFDDLSSQIVVNAMYAKGFEQNDVLGIKDAKVFLYDNAGNQYRFLPDTFKSWEYKLKTSEIEINPEYEYHISLETTDGERFESIPEKFPSPVNVTEIHAEPGTYEKVDISSTGSVITETVKGIYVSSSVLSTDNSPIYVRFKNNAIVQSTYTETSSIFPIIWNCVKYAVLNSNPIVENSMKKNGKPMIYDRELGFLEYYVDNSTLSETTSARYLTGWIVITDVYSISENTYNYYKKIENQLNGTYGIFDPVPSQIKGNIFCTTDPDQITLGIFEISKRVRKYNYFFWLPDHPNCTQKVLDSYISPRSTTCVDSIPEFDWIIPN